MPSKPLFNSRKLMEKAVEVMRNSIPEPREDGSPILPIWQETYCSLYWRASNVPTRATNTSPSGKWDETN